MIVVANSSVLIALCRIGMLNLLYQKFTEGIFIPEAVWYEVVESGRGQPGSEEVSSSPWIKVKKVKDEKLISLLRIELDEGEAEAIVLASELKADLVLLDEKAARKVAKRLGLQVLGTIGVLIWAKRAGFDRQFERAIRCSSERRKFSYCPGCLQQGSACRIRRLTKGPTGELKTQLYIAKETFANPDENTPSLYVIASEAKQSNVEGIFGQAKNSTPYFQRGRIR